MKNTEKNVKRHLGDDVFGKERENKGIGQKPYLKEVAEKFPELTKDSKPQN